MEFNDPLLTAVQRKLILVMKEPLDPATAICLTLSSSALYSVVDLPEDSVVEGDGRSFDSEFD